VVDFVVVMFCLQLLYRMMGLISESFTEKIVKITTEELLRLYMFSPTQVQEIPFAGRSLYIKRDDLIHPQFSGIFLTMSLPTSLSLSVMVRRKPIHSIPSLC
jgi:hypothetical protein